MINHKIRMIKKCQWLTVNSDPLKQTWATSHGLNYSRTAYRLRIIIPGKHLRNLVAAGEFVKALPVEARYFVEDWTGSEDWYIYRGEILPQWIKEIVKS
jgi:hypothetical protein